MTFFFTFLFVFLVFWRPQEWLVTWLYGWNLLDGVFYLALLGLLIEVDAGRIRFPKDMPQVYLLGGLWFAGIMSHVAHTYFAGMMDTILPVFKVCFFTLLLFCVMDTPSRVRAVALMFVVMACFMSVNALLQERRGYGFAGIRPVYVGAKDGHPAYLRSTFFGIFEDPNDLAQMLVTSIPFAFAITKRRSFFGFLLGSGATWLFVRAMLATHSRGGIVALVATGAVMIVILLPVRWFPYLMSALLICGLALCPLSAGYLDDSAHDRVAFWGTANWVFKENPLFGVGWGMFGEYIEGDRAAHNAFVLCYTELGVFGYWFWFSLLQLGVVGAWRTKMVFKKPETQDQAWLARMAGLSIAAITGYCASAYFLTRAFVYPAFFLFALLGVLPWIARDHLPEDHPRLIEPKRDLFLLCTLGTICSIFYIYFSIILLNKAWMM